MNIKTSYNSILTSNSRRQIKQHHKQKYRTWNHQLVLNITKVWYKKIPKIEHTTIFLVAIKKSIFGLKNNLTRNHITVWKQNYLHFYLFFMFYSDYLIPMPHILTHLLLFLKTTSNTHITPRVLAINRMTHLDVSYWNITISHT